MGVITPLSSLDMDQSGHESQPQLQIGVSLSAEEPSRKDVFSP